MLRFSALAILAALALGSCQSYDADDLAADTACGAREQICRDQCFKAYEASGNADRYSECTLACEPPGGTVCR
jgi:hypothetical protein